MGQYAQKKSTLRVPLTPGRNLKRRIGKNKLPQTNPKQQHQPLEANRTDKNNNNERTSAEYKQETRALERARREQQIKN